MDSFEAFRQGTYSHSTPDHKTYYPSHVSPDKFDIPAEYHSDFRYGRYLADAYMMIWTADTQSEYAGDVEEFNRYVEGVNEIFGEGTMELWTDKPGPYRAVAIHPETGEPTPIMHYSV